jgi:hypothetical protein
MRLTSLVWHACGNWAPLVLLGALLHAARAEELVSEIPADQSAAVAEAAIAAKPPQQQSSDPAQRSREGTRLEKQIGWFKTTGDRLTFHVQGGDGKYLGLENLALERIAKIISDRHDHPEQVLWEVSGTLTEYRGVNYLLVSHAVLKNKQHRAPPGVAQGGR